MGFKKYNLWMVDLVCLSNFIMFMANKLMKTLGDTNAAVHRYLEPTPTRLRARSQIPVYGLTGRGIAAWSAAPGAGFCGQNLGIKYIPCVGIHL